MSDIDTALDVSEAGSTLSMISELRGGGEPPPEPTTETSAPEPAKADAPAIETTAEPAAEADDAELEARRTALMREIALDPSLTQRYAQQQYAPQQQPQIEQPPELPFDEFTFDPSNPAHQQALFDARLQEVGGPLFDKIDRIAQRFEQEDQQRQQQQIEGLAKQANQKTVAFLDTYVPGFSTIAEKLGGSQPLTAQEKAIFNEAVNAESAIVSHYAEQMAQQNQVPYQQAYNYLLHDVQARAQIAQIIGPELKKYASELGLVSQPRAAQLTPEQRQVMKQESYVESSNAVPATSAGSFDKAHQKGDTLSMIRALRGTA